MKGDRLYKLAFKKASKKKFNKKEVFELLDKSFTLGNPKAAYAIGNWHIHGIYVKKDYKKAVGYFRFAADKNNPDACFNLAISLEKGKGTGKNLNSAFIFYLKSTLLGNKQALVEVGRCYYHGIGVKKNQKLADVFLDRAEELGIKW